MIEWRVVYISELSNSSSRCISNVASLSLGPQCHLSTLQFSLSCFKAKSHSGLPGILKLYEEVLMNQECTATAAQFLTRLPDDLCVDSLFRAIASVRTSAHKRTLAQILQENMDAMSASDV